MDCNICLQSPSDPIITTCGHLFCWPCIYTWLNSNLQLASCPMCRFHLIQHVNIIPVYQSGDKNARHVLNTNCDGEVIPCRPNPPHFLQESARSEAQPSIHEQELEDRMYTEMAEEVERNMRASRERVRERVYIEILVEVEREVRAYREQLRIRYIEMIEEFEIELGNFRSRYLYERDNSPHAFNTNRDSEAIPFPQDSPYLPQENPRSEMQPSMAQVHEGLHNESEEE